MTIAITLVPSVRAAMLSVASANFCLPSGGKLYLYIMGIRNFVAGRAAIAVSSFLNVRAGQPLLAVSINKGELCGGAEGLNRFLRIGDLRDLNRYAVLAAEGYG